MMPEIAKISASSIMPPSTVSRIPITKPTHAARQSHACLV